MSESTGEIVVRRTTAYRDRARKYKVLIDGEEVGTISNGEEKTFLVTTGEHELRLKVDWAGSPTERVSVGPGQSVHFVCSAGKAASAALDMFRPKQWIKLERGAE